jgi:GT2 family glycosyltransferase
MNKQPISIVIPNYNGIKLLPIVIDSVIEAVNFSTVAYEIIIIDDCSTDNSVLSIQERYPEVKFIRNVKNIGFSESVNKGVNNAIYELVLVLNNDVKLMPNYFEDQFRFFDLKDTFGVNGTIINWDDEQLQGGGKILKFKGFKIKSNTNYYIQNPTRNNLYKTHFLTGTNAMVSKQKFIELGGFCQLFSPYYVEDLELSMRALRMGYKCYYSESSLCKHQISATIKKHATKSTILQTNIRNKFFFHIIHLNSINLFGWFLQLFFESLYRLMTFKKAFLRALYELFLQRKAVFLYRKNFNLKLKKTNKNNDAKDIIRDLNKEILAYNSIITS